MIRRIGKIKNSITEYLSESAEVAGSEPKGQKGLFSGRLRVADLFVWAAVIVIGVALVLVFLAGKRLGDRVVVTVDGKTVGQYSLFEEVDTVIEGDDGGTNHLIIRDGEAWIEDASCPDKLCVHQGRIKHITESVVCLPNRVVVRVIKSPVSGNSGDIDAVVQ